MQKCRADSLTIGGKSALSLSQTTSALLTHVAAPHHTTRWERSENIRALYSRPPFIFGFIVATLPCSPRNEHQWSDILNQWHISISTVRHVYIITSASMWLRGRNVRKWRQQQYLYLFMTITLLQFNRTAIKYMLSHLHV